MGGIYSGVFTPTEAAGIGASGAFLITLGSGKLNFAMLSRALSNAARTTAMLFFLVIGALIFSKFINLTGMPLLLKAWVTSQDFSPMKVILLLVVIYLLLGCVLESMSRSKSSYYIDFKRKTRVSSQDLNSSLQGCVI